MRKRRKKQISDSSDSLFKTFKSKKGAGYRLRGQSKKVKTKTEKFLKKLDKTQRKEVESSHEYKRTKMFVKRALTSENKSEIMSDVTELERKFENSVTGKYVNAVADMNRRKTYRDKYGVDSTYLRLVNVLGSDLFQKLKEANIFTSDDLIQLNYHIGDDVSQEVMELALEIVKDDIANPESDLEGMDAFQSVMDILDLNDDETVEAYLNKYEKSFR